MENKYFSPFSKEELMPRAERLEVGHKREKMRIGIPLEMDFQEKRVCLTPDAVEVLVANGHDVVVESGAGRAAHYEDNLYSESGAKISYSREEVFNQNIILKVEPPTEAELGYIKPYSFLISAVQPNTRDRAFFECLSNKKITAIGFEYFEDEHNHLPIVRLISEIAGTGAILVAAELLSTSSSGNGIMIGGVAGVRPAEVMILGGGTVGEYAAKSALGLGASVRIFDNSLTRLRRLQNSMGTRISTNTLDPKEMVKALRRCDVAIGALRGVAQSPTVITEEMVKYMKSGAIIIDVSIDSGGCFETSKVTTHENPTFIKHDVIHYGVTNITSRYSRTASKALSNFFLPYLLDVAKGGGFESVIVNDLGLRKGIYIYKGRHTNKKLANWFDLDFIDINLLIL